MQRLRHYVLRPPFAQERLRLGRNGRVTLELKTAWHDGTRELEFEPLEFHQLPGKPVVMKNSSSSARLKFILFQIGPEGPALTVPVM
jgi:hypothetical protein